MKGGPSDIKTLNESILALKDTLDKAAEFKKQGLLDQEKRARENAIALFKPHAFTDLMARKERLASGGYERELRAARLLTREREKVERAERKIGLQLKYGRRLGAVAAFAADHERTLQAAGRIGMYAAGTVSAIGGGMVKQGFSNTTEGNRFELEMTLASRELAGSFKPAMEGATRAVRGFRQWLEKRSPQEQDAIQGAGLALAGGLATHLLMRQLFGVGVGGAALAAGRGAMSGIGALTAGGMLPMAGRVAGGLGAGAMVASSAAIAGAGVATALDSSEQHSYYALFRNRGMSKLTASLSSVVASGAALVGDYGDFDSQQEQKRAIAKGQRKEVFKGNKEEDLILSQKLKEREAARKVTPAITGFDETGSGYYRLWERLSLLDDSLDRKSDKEMLGLILEELKRITGNTQETPKLNR